MNNFRFYLPILLMIFNSCTNHLSKKNKTLKLVNQSILINRNTVKLNKIKITKIKKYDKYEKCYGNWKIVDIEDFNFVQIQINKNFISFLFKDGNWKRYKVNKITNDENIHSMFIIENEYNDYCLYFQASKVYFDACCDDCSTSELIKTSPHPPTQTPTPLVAPKTPPTKTP